ncbi:unnamed protein product [Sphagnum troendelagicum]|uniref:Peptidase A2 domain-containing protein n=1 Tax=Sphagnum troendelagicum TaxID=128251 RepID=A0ABP0V364_9BRYO
MVSAVPTIRRLCINKTHRNKMLHLSMEINHYPIEGLVDTGASMSVMAVSVVRDRIGDRLGEGPSYRYDADARERMPESSETEDGSILLCGQGTDKKKKMQESEFDSDSSEDSDEGTQSISPVEDTS